jgi:CcmD family protein
MEANGYLVAGLAVVWAVVMAYVYYLGTQLRALARQVQALEDEAHRESPGR